MWVFIRFEFQRSNPYLQYGTSNSNTPKPTIGIVLKNLIFFFTLKLSDWPCSTIAISRRWLRVLNGTICFHLFNSNLDLMLVDRTELKTFVMSREWRAGVVAGLFSSWIQLSKKLKLRFGLCLQSLSVPFVLSYMTGRSKQLMADYF